MQIGLPTILGILFITLKLCGVIAWSWVWVLAPFWLGAAIVLVLLLVWLAIYLTVAVRATNGWTSARYRR